MSKNQPTTTISCKRLGHLSQRVRSEGRRQHGVVLNPGAPVRGNSAQEDDRVEGYPADGDHDGERDELDDGCTCFVSPKRSVGFRRPKGA